jgi:hypothetical protein
LPVVIAHDEARAIVFERLGRRKVAVLRSHFMASSPRKNNAEIPDDRTARDRGLGPLPFPVPTFQQSLILWCRPTAP